MLPRVPLVTLIDALATGVACGVGAGVVAAGVGLGVVGAGVGAGVVGTGVGIGIVAMGVGMGVGTGVGCAFLHAITPRISMNVNINAIANKRLYDMSTSCFLLFITRKSWQPYFRYFLWKERRNRADVSTPFLSTAENLSFACHPEAQPTFKIAALT